ncbi:MAG: hypothetical protein AB7K14_13665 [Lysobacterales bacterium]
MGAAERLCCACLIALPLSLPAPARALSLTPIEFAGQTAAVAPALTDDGAGGFVVTYTERRKDGAELRFLHLDAKGTILDRGRIAASAPGQTWFVNWADFPSLSVLDNGDWVSFFLQKSGVGSYAYDIHLTRSHDQGRHWSKPLRLNRDGTQSEHGFVSLLPAGGDKVLAIWLDGRHSAAASPSTKAAGDQAAAPSGAMSLRSAVIDARGRFSQESEIDARTCDCCSTDAVQSGGHAALVYRDRSEDEIRDTRFSRREADGRWSAPALVHADQWRMPACPVNGPALADNQGRLLALWSTMPDGPMRVRAAFGDGQGFGAMQEIEAGEGVLGRVDASAFGARGFLIAWLGAAAEHPEQSALKLAVLDSERGLQEQTTVIELPRGRSIGFPRLASIGNIALLAWTEPSESGSRIRLLRISP